jgi:hypothetical protein
MTTKVNRSSVSGRFVTEQFTKTHPKTTQTETVRRPSPQPSPGNKPKKG